MIKINMSESVGFGNVKIYGNYSIGIGNNIIIHNDYEVKIHYDDIDFSEGSPSFLTLESRLNQLHICRKYRITVDDIIKATTFVLNQFGKSVHKPYNYYEKTYTFFHMNTSTLILYYYNGESWNHQILNRNDKLEKEIELLKQENKRLMDAIDSLEFNMQKIVEAYLEKNK
jgi:hypothetical protein